MSDEEVPENPDEIDPNMEPNPEEDYVNYELPLCRLLKMENGYTLIGTIIGEYPDGFLVHKPMKLISIPIGAFKILI